MLIVQASAFEVLFSFLIALSGLILIQALTGYEIFLQVNSNGVLSLGNTGFSQFRTRPFPFHSPPLIAPFWADFDPRVEGHISYRQTNDSALLQVIHLLVMDLDDEDFVSFVPTNLFIATWDKVPPFAHRGEEV